MQVLHPGLEVILHEDDVRPRPGDGLHCLVPGGDAWPIVVGGEPDLVGVMSF